tara:strand:+ start:285 stop:665 length:381 start_codon:yes stop_codon:yes gene_type:complete
MSYVKAKASDFTIDCHCGHSVRRKMTASNYQFAMTPTSTNPQNTGVYSFDTNADRIIGKDSEEKWKKIEKRQKEKHSLLQNNPDKNGFDIRRRLDNHYEIAPTQDRQAYEKGMGVVWDAKSKGKKV